MGTETKHCILGLHSSKIIFVKLNNPLMGTETLSRKYHYNIYSFHSVKLNNPLMGTETTLCVIGN